MHTEMQKCRRCKNIIGVAVTTKSAQRIKFIAWTECDICSHTNHMVWSSGIEEFFVDPNQLLLFQLEELQGAEV